MNRMASAATMYSAVMTTDIEKSAKEFGLELSGIIPDDPLIREFDLSGKPTTQLTMKSKAVEKAFKIFEAIL